MTAICLPSALSSLYAAEAEVHPEPWRCINTTSPLSAPPWSGLPTVRRALNDRAPTRLCTSGWAARAIIRAAHIRSICMFRRVFRCGWRQDDPGPLQLGSQLRHKPRTRFGRCQWPRWPNRSRRWLGRGRGDQGEQRDGHEHATRTRSKAGAAPARSPAGHVKRGEHGGVRRRGVSSCCHGILICRCRDAAATSAAWQIVNPMLSVPSSSRLETNPSQPVANWRDLLPH
jgi:hypothetical protein